METLNIKTFENDFLEYLNPFKQERNMKGRTYSYLAKLSDYQTTTSINRNFFDHTLIEYRKDDVFIIAKKVLDSFEINDIIEIGLNVKQSSQYSLVSKTYLKIVENSNGVLSFEVYPTACKAFKSLINNLIFNQ